MDDVEVEYEEWCDPECLEELTAEDEVPMYDLLPPLDCCCWVLDELWAEEEEAEEERLCLLDAPPTPLRLLLAVLMLLLPFLLPDEVMAVCVYIKISLQSHILYILYIITKGMYSNMTYPIKKKNNNIIIQM